MDQTSLLYQKIDKESEEITSNGNSIKTTHTNADEIFQILSQKISKYCQILSDLTNCEVFFKSNLNSRSLYWGTYKMMFNYSHQGLQYDRNDSLIKISGRSLSNDISNIVEELLNVENFDKIPQATNQNEFEQEKFSGDDAVELRDCVVFMDRLDDTLYEHYLQKFEKSRVFNEDDLSINEMYLNLNNNNSMIENSNDIETVKEDLFICEICNLFAFKHQPELKVI
jgi:hypothetical protein